MKIYCHSLGDTKKLGNALGKLFQPGDVVSLVGDLGAGKTTFTKALGEGMGISSYITSATFTLMNEYPGDIPLYHFDTYRLENIEDIDDLGFDDYFFGNGVSVVEWGDRIEEWLPKDHLTISIEDAGELERIFTFTSHGERSEKLLEGVKHFENIGN